MNQMKRDRKSLEDIRIQVSLIKMNTFIGTTAMVKTLFCFETFAELTCIACMLDNV